MAVEVAAEKSEDDERDCSRKADLSDQPKRKKKRLLKHTDNLPAMLRIAMQAGEYTNLRITNNFILMFDNTPYASPVKIDNP